MRPCTRIAVNSSYACPNVVHYPGLIFRKTLFVKYGCALGIGPLTIFLFYCTAEDVLALGGEDALHLCPLGKSQPTSSENLNGEDRLVQIWLLLFRFINHDQTNHKPTTNNKQHSLHFTRDPMSVPVRCRRPMSDA